MKAILVFIDGTICDTRQRHYLKDNPDFYQHDHILEDIEVPGSAACLDKLSRRYQIVYIGARPVNTKESTDSWLVKKGFPKGPVFLGETQEERLKLVKEMAAQFDFIAGIGDRWDDNELFTELGCLSIILQEFEGNWSLLFEKIVKFHREKKIAENRIHLEGKVEGLARVCPLLLSGLGEKLWETYQASVQQLADNTRASRQTEELTSFKRYHLDPTNLKDAAKWHELGELEDWEHNSVYGLQDHEVVEASKNRFIHEVTRCYYADLWKKVGLPEIGYQIHCNTDHFWWDKPAWNEKVRFEQPKTIMHGDEYCLFIQSLPDNGE